MKLTRIAVLAVLGLFYAFPVHAQTPDPPVSIINITGTATGFGNNGIQKANIATAGVQLTKAFSGAYEQINVEGMADHFKLAMLNYSNTADKFLGPLKKHLLFDPSNYVVTLSVGGGKFGKHVAETGAISLTYPIASHIGWQILSYQYVHSPVSGVVNKSYQSASSGPIFWF